MRILAIALGCCHVRFGRWGVERLRRQNEPKNVVWGATLISPAKGSRTMAQILQGFGTMV